MLKAKFLGHACWLLSSDDFTIVIDPYLTSNQQAAVRADDVRVDAVLLTHGHFDHVEDALSIALRNDALIIGCDEIARYYRIKGARSHGMHIGGGFTFPFGRVKLVPAVHGSGLEVDGEILYLGEAGGFVVEMGGRTVYHAGDTGLFSDMKLISRTTAIDLALLPIGDNFTMGSDDAVEAVKYIEPVRVVPMHYNTFPVIPADPEEFATRVRQETRAHCEVVQPGQEIQI